MFIECSRRNYILTIFVEKMVRYFVHGTYAGQSAFINVPDDSAHRNARMLAVGVLVPLKKGRLGKAWMHAPALKELVRCVSFSSSPIYQRRDDPKEN